MPFRHPVKNVNTCHSKEGDLGAVCLLGGSGSPRPQGARDDKSGAFTMKGVKRLEFSLCHCEEDRMDDAAIHRVLGEGGRVCLFVYWLTVDRHASRGSR